MEAASDDWFVDADDDGFADLAIVGRLPARSDAQVAAMVSKIIGYEQGAGGDWQRSVLLVSDRDPTGGVDFAALNDRARELVPDTYQVTHIRRGIDPDAGAAVKARLSEGAALVSYAGTRLGGVMATGPAHDRGCAQADQRQQAARRHRAELLQRLLPEPVP